MEDPISQRVAVISMPFTVPGLGRTLPAGEYDIETDLSSLPDHHDPEAWTATVLARMHSRSSNTGRARTLTVSLADLDEAKAMDKQTGKFLSDIVVEEMLADPIVRLVIEADGVSADQLRKLYRDKRAHLPDSEGRQAGLESKIPRDCLSIQAAENEGMPTRAHQDALE